MNLAPIVIFTYKRVEPLQQTIECLLKNSLASESEVFIFSDGPKTSDDQVYINEVRRYLHSIEGFRKVTIKESATNKGLANSIINGVTEIFQLYDKVIVMEDDLLTTVNFLSYMNQALERYKDEKQVYSISGYSFDFGNRGEANGSYFLNRSWSWGWASWKDRWSDIDWQVKDYIQFRSSGSMKRKFAQGGSDLNRMLRKQMEGELDSWAIRWFYHQYKCEGITLYPVRSKVYNIGFDQFATHTKGVQKKFITRIDNSNSGEFDFPATIGIDPYYQRRFQRKMGLRSRFISRIHSLFSSLL